MLDVILKTALVTSLGQPLILIVAMSVELVECRIVVRILTIIQLIFNYESKQPAESSISIKLVWGSTSHCDCQQTLQPIQEPQQTQRQLRVRALPLDSHKHATATNTSSAPANVVISEFRPTGPNGGNDEFVELYNRSGSPVSIGNWIIRRSSGCGTSVAIAATISAGVTLAARSALPDRWEHI